jgi:macrolide transport system ATP-binding/permease protein
MSLLRRVGNLFVRSKVDREIEAELQSHIELRTETNIASGMEPGVARRDARLRFGNPVATRERVAGADAALKLASLGADVRFACRQLARNPGFAATAIGVLALGAGASVAIFAFVNAALLRPLPYADPARLVSVYESLASCPRCNVSYLNFRDWQRENKVYQSLEAWGYSAVTLNTAAGTESVMGTRVSDGFFRALGVRPMLGRDFYPGEDAPGKPRVALLSYASWQARYGGRRDAVGQTVTLDGMPATVIGVLPPEFHFAPRGEAEYWMPLNDPNGCERRRACHNLFGLGRLRDGVTVASALANTVAMAKALEMQYPDTNRGETAAVVPLSETVIGEIRPILLTLFAGACLLLTIAYVNVVSLLLVRTESRRREMAVRGALGATPARLLRQFVTEAVVLAGAGSVLGLGLAWLAMTLLPKMIPANRLDQMPFLIHAGWDARVLGFAGTVTAIAVMLFAVTPALGLLRGAAGSLRGDLANGGRGAGSQVWHRLGTRLIVVELATATVLLVGAGLLGKSFYLLLHVKLGMEPDHVATLVVSVPKPYLEDTRLMNLERELTHRAESLPGVRSAAIASHLPVHAWDGGVPLVVPGRADTGERTDFPERDVSAGYLKTIGATLLHGRYFTESEDDALKPRVVVINEAMARHFFPGEDAVGKRLAYDEGKETLEILGVVADVKEGPLDTANRPTVYVPFNQDAFLSFYVLVRTTQEEGSILPALAAAVHGIDRELTVSEGSTLATTIGDSNAAYLHRCAAWLVGGFSAIALLLTVVGLYGVIAYSVSQRTREIGVRMALGAARGTVSGMVRKEAARLTAIGTAAGLGCAVGAGGLMRKLLFETPAWDVPTLAAVAVLLAAAAMLASYLPAHRAASLNPVDALRAE